MVLVNILEDIITSKTIDLYNIRSKSAKHFYGADWDSINDGIRNKTMENVWVFGLAIRHYTQRKRFK